MKNATGKKSPKRRNANSVILPGCTELYQPNRLTYGRYKSFTLLQSRILITLMKELQEAVLASMNGNDWQTLNIFASKESNLIRVPIRLKDIAHPRQYKEIYEAALQLGKASIQLPSSISKQYLCIATLFPRVELPKIVAGNSIMYVELFKDAARKLIEIDRTGSGRPGYFTKYLYEVAMSATNNDFLQIYIEQGIVGLFIFVAILFLALSVKETTEVKYKYSLFALIVGCLASYPLEVPEILFTVMIITAIISLNKPGRVIDMGKGVFIYLIFFTSITILCLLKLFNTHQARNNVKAADKFIEKKQYNLTVSIFKKNFSALYFDYDFLTAYAKTLFSAENYTKSLLIINMAKKYSCEPYLYITEGDNFMKLGLNGKAEEAYSIAAKMYPSLMYPKYKLAKFYYITDNISMAKSVAQGIMKMKIKIPSPAVQEMRADMLGILAN